MSDSIISQLPAASSMDGTESLPMVQGGVTKKGTVEQIATRATVSAVAAAVAAVTQPQPFQLTSLNGSALSGFRNKIVNPGMQIDQRNCYNVQTLSRSFVLYGADCWGCAQSGGLFVATSQVIEDGPIPAFPRSLKMIATDVYLPGVNAFNFVQGFEVHDLRDLVGKPFTLSFWYKSSVTGNHLAQFGAGAPSQTVTTFQFQVLEENTWEFKTIKFLNALDGVTWAAPVRAVELGGQIAIGLQVNSSVLGPTTIPPGATIQLTGVALEPGVVATAPEPRPLEIELGLCRRQYETSYTTNVVPGTNGGYALYGPRSAVAQDTRAMYGNMSFMVPKRTPPAVVIYSLAGTQGAVTSASTNLDTGSIVRVYNSGTNGISYISSDGVVLGTGPVYLFHFTADASFQF